MSNNNYESQESQENLTPLYSMLYNEDGRVRIDTSLADLEAFVTGSIWGDIKRVVQAEIVEKQVELENPTLDVIATALIRGDLQRLRLVLELGDTLVSMKEAENEPEESTYD